MCGRWSANVRFTPSWCTLTTCESANPRQGWRFTGLLVDDLLLAYPSHRTETLMPFSDDELAEILGLTPDQAARVPTSFWVAAREFLAS